jgi:hypothetical protein
MTNRSLFLRPASDVHSVAPFTHVETLIVDNNELTSASGFPPLPHLRVLWVNKNNITHYQLFIERLAAACPALRELSLLGNPGVPSYFNGGTLAEYKDYRLYVISKFRQLQVLDQSPVRPEERADAQRIYGSLRGL